MKQLKQYLIIAAIALAVVAIATIAVQHNRIIKLRQERNRYRENVEVMMQDVQIYKTSDSLNAAKAGALELKMKEFEKYRKDDARLIKTLQVKNRELQAVASAQTQTIAELRTNVRDSIVYLPGDTVRTVIRCVDVVDAWFELHGCANAAGEFSGTFVNRDSLLVAETIKRKRFLGFLWKTNKIANRQIDVVSKNPHTQISNVDFVVMEK